MIREWIAEADRSLRSHSISWVSLWTERVKGVPAATGYSPTICATARATTPCSCDAFATLTGMSFANASS